MGNRLLQYLPFREFFLSAPKAPENPKPLTAAIFNDTAIARHYGCELVMAQLKQQLLDVGITTIWTRSVNTDWRLDRDLILELPRPDIVIVNGEGSIHHTARNNRAQSLVQLGNFVRTQLDVPAVLLNTTLHAMQDSDREYLREYDAIYLRSRASKRILARIGLHNGKVVQDLTLCTTPPASGEPRRGVLSTDSTIPAITALLDEESKRNDWHYMSMAHKGARPHALDAGLWAQSPPMAFIDHLQKHSYAVTGRFHCATLAVLTKTPVVAIESNTPKIRSLFQDVFGDTKRILPPEKLKGLDLSQFDYTAAELRKIDRFLLAHRKQAAAMFRSVRNLAANQDKLHRA